MNYATLPYEEKSRILDADAARIRQKNGETEPEPEPSEPVEILGGQRLYLEQARQRAIQAVEPRSAWANPLDWETKVQIAMSQETGMAFCNTTFFGDRPLTVDKLAEAYVEVESGTRKTDRLIDKLKDEILDLKHQLGRKQGGKN